MWNGTVFIRILRQTQYSEMKYIGAIYSFQTRFEYVHSKQFKGGHGANSETYYGTSFLLVHFLS